MTWARKHPKAIQQPRSGAFVVRAINAERSLPPEFETASKRAKRMGDVDLLTWADNALSGIGRCLDDDRHEPGTGDALREAERAAVTLYATLHELASRKPVPAATDLPSVSMLRRMTQVTPG